MLTARVSTLPLALCAKPGTIAPVVVLISGREAATYGARLEEAAARGFIAKRELSGAALSALVG